VKLEIGNKMPNLTVDTIFKRQIPLKELLGDKKTAVLFLRYAGCTLCRFDMLMIKEEYEPLTEAGDKVIVVLQSNADKLSKEIDKDFYPYDIICDPEESLYKQFEIKAANSQEEMIGPGTMEKIKEVQASGLTHGDYEGNEMQLPAVFIVDKNLTVLYEHYAAHLTDMPNVHELKELFKS
jgi:peroxiredoxin